MYEDVAPRDWIFEIEPGGKPYVAFSGADSSAGPPLSFNLSHTHGLVACAVTRDGDVGIDVERIDRAVDAREIAARHFTEIEATFVAAGTGRRSSGSVFCHDVWTLKEAFVKAVGRGLMQPLREFGFLLEGPHDIRLDIIAPPGAPSGDTGEWAFALFAPSPDTRMAVAARSAAGVTRRVVTRPGDGTEGVEGARPVLTSLRSRGFV